MPREYKGYGSSRRDVAKVMDRIENELIHKMFVDHARDTTGRSSYTGRSDGVKLTEHHATYYDKPNQNDWV